MLNMFSKIKQWFFHMHFNEDVELYGTQFFWFCIKTMKIIGLWPVEQENLRRPFVKSLFVVHFLATTITLTTLELMYMYMSLTDNYYEFLKTAGTAMYHFICIMRVVHWLMIREDIVTLVVILERQSFKELVFTSKWKEECKKFIHNARVLCYTLYYVMNICGVLSLLFSYIHTVAVPVQEYDNILNTTVFKRVLPYNSYSITNSNSKQAFILKLIFNFYTMIYTNFCMLCKYRNHALYCN